MACKETICRKPCLRQSLLIHQLPSLFKFQIFRAKPQNTLSVHFRWITGRDFQLNVTDGSASNKTLITNITADYIGKTVRSASSPVLEISFSSKSNAREPTYLVFIIMENEGMRVFNLAESVKRHIFAENVARLHVTYNVISHIYQQNSPVIKKAILRFRWELNPRPSRDNRCPGHLGSKKQPLCKYEIA